MQTIGDARNLEDCNLPDCELLNAIGLRVLKSKAAQQAIFLEVIEDFFKLRNSSMILFSKCLVMTLNWRSFFSRMKLGKVSGAVRSLQDRIFEETIPNLTGSQFQENFRICPSTFDLERI